MNIKDYLYAIHWYVDLIYGNDSNTGKDDWSNALLTVTKCLEHIQGLTSIVWAGGMPGWVTSEYNVQRMPSMFANVMGFKIKWRKPGDGYVYFCLAVDPDGGFALEEYPGPEVKLPETQTWEETVWLYDGLCSNIRHRELPSFGIKLGLNPSGLPGGTSGEQLFETSCTYDSCHFNVRVRHVIHITGGFIQEVVPVIRANIEFDGVGVSFGNAFLYAILGLLHTETTFYPPVIDDTSCELPILTVFGGIPSFDGTNLGVVVNINDSIKLINAVTAGDTQMEVDSWIGMGFADLTSRRFKVGKSSDPAEILLTSDIDFIKFTESDNPQPTESTPGGGYDLIVFDDSGGVYDDWVGTHGLSSGKFTANLFLTGFAFEYTNLEKIEDPPGTFKSKMTLSAPIDPDILAVLDFIGGISGGLIPFEGWNHVANLDREFAASWPAGTPVETWSPPAISDLWGLKYSFNECAICSSTAGLLVPAYVGISSAIAIMTGLWEMQWEGRNVFFINGEGTPAILNYSFLPKRKRLEETYFLFLGKGHIFDFPPFTTSFPWGSPMDFDKPMLDRLSIVTHCAILYLNNGSIDDIIRDYPDKVYEIWFEQNFYAKTVGKIGEWLRDFLLGEASPETMAFELFSKKNTYPNNSNYKDTKPMLHPDEFRSATLTSRIPGGPSSREL